MKSSDFKMIDAKSVTQGQLEKWQEEMVALREGKALDDLMQSTYRRHLVTAAIRAGWFSSMPEGFTEESLLEMRPGNLDALSNKVTEAYSIMVEPDESFT